MVHLRLNETEPNPNPHVNFITALPVEQPEDGEVARQLLRALAAQVRPIMKSYGFVVNSLEEYEYNAVFSGRNWNHGETVELVLRKPDGSFFPTYWLISVLCHELAHIKHMNHGSDFQVLWSRLRAEVRALQDRGYFGDGYWSSGQRLSDSARVKGDGIDPGDLPEFMCGGAQSQTRPTSMRRRRGEASGRSIKKRKRKAGMRLPASAFVGQGSKLSEGSTDGPGTGFRKQARSKRAREERALAAERRITTLRGVSASFHRESKIEESEEETDSEVEIIETDAQRRQALLDSGERNSDLIRLDESDSWREFQREFNFGYKPLSNDIDDCDLPVASGSTFTTAVIKEKKPQLQSSTCSTSSPPSMSSRKGKAPPGSCPGKLIQSEIQLRKKEALGMTDGGWTLADSDDEIIVVSESRRNPNPITPRPSEPSSESQWECLVCTLLNQPAHLACSACSVPRGESSWKEP